MRHKTRHRSFAVHFNKCPGGKTQAADFGTNRKRIYWNGEVAVSDGYVHSSTHQSGQYFEFGGHTVRIVAKSHDGNHQANCNFGVTITDEEIPNITFCPGDVYITLGDGETSKSSPSIPDSTVIDYIDDNPIKVVLYESDEFFAGVTRVSHIYTDFSCNRAVCEFSVILQSTEPCPGSTFEGNCYIMECGNSNYNDYVSNCQSMNAEPVSIHSNAENEFLRQICIDSGHSSVFIGLEAVGYSWGQLTHEHLDWTDGTPVDFIDDAQDLESYLPERCHAFDRGRNHDWEEVSCNAGYCGICKNTIVVSNGPLPDFVAALEQSCPSNIVMETESGVDYATATWTPPVVTIDGQNVPITSSHQPGDQFILGTTLVEISATHSGATGYCKFTVYVDDWENAVISSPACSLETYNLAVGASTMTYQVTPVISDNSGSFTHTCATGGWNTICPGDIIGPGTYLVRHDVSEEGWCTSPQVCTYYVVVYDVEDPVITCPSTITDAVTDLDSPHAALTLEDPTATDNVGVTSLSCDQSGLRNMPIGVSTITCTARDAATNQDQCTYDVTVTDIQSPDVIFCPDVVEVNVSPLASEAPGSWTNPTFLDNSGVAPSVTSTHTNGQNFPLGDTTVNVTATDGAGLEIQCQFIVRLFDVTAPVFTNCHSDIVVNTLPGGELGSASWNELQATDNSLVDPVIDDVTLVGGDYPIGETAIEFNATDKAGNTATCGFTVTVIDNESPVFSGCHDDISLPTDALLPTTNVVWSDPIASDNSGVSPLVNQSFYPNDVFRLGIHEVTYIATDFSGNEAQCNFSITIFDSEDPIFFNGSRNLVLNTNPGLPTSPVWWSVTDIARDNSEEIPIINCTYVPGHVFRFGNYTINCVATDDAGNYAIHTFYVAIIGTLELF
ncbi:hyalin-like [Antedon mediterranea]|uniref:hyalin-like n=1 Tax=Antedon mediterranea TaxID=105859 RepID=UPI003AF93178